VKVSKRQMKRIIREEVNRFIHEQDGRELQTPAIKFVSWENAYDQTELQFTVDGEEMTMMQSGGVHDDSVAEDLVYHWLDEHEPPDEEFNLLVADVLEQLRTDLEFSDEVSEMNAQMSQYAEDQHNDSW
jgi:hypothetical protein